MLIECQQLTKCYGSQVALDHIDLSINSNQIIGLLGPNGSGKTTFLKLLNGLLTPSTGKILIEGNEPSIQTKSIVSYLPERNSLPLWMKIHDLLIMYQDFFLDFDKQKANDMLADLKIDTKKTLQSLSKGTREKVQLVLTLSRNARLYCLDEPIGGVDPASRDYIIKTILGSYCEDSTILISTHLIQDIENILDYAIIMKEGNVYLNGMVDELRETYHKSIDSIFREEFKC